MKGGIQGLLQRVFVARFYRINAGFFLFLFLLLFGIIEPRDSIRFHYALMQMMAGHAQYLAIGCAVFTLYYIKCISFCLRNIGTAENNFLFELQAIPPRRQWLLFAGFLTAMYAPVLLYATCTAVIAAAEHQYASLAALMIYQAAALAAGISIVRRSINHITRETPFSRMLRFLQGLRPQTVQYYQYLIAYALQQKKALLFLLKVGSLILLQLMVALNEEKLQPEGTYFFLLGIIIGHALLPYYFVRFTEENNWLRNMPVSMLRRYGYFAMTYAVLFVPELIFLLVHVQQWLSFPVIFSLYALAVTMLCWLHTILYVRGTGAERYTIVLFLLVPVTMFLVAAINIWWLSLFLLLSSGLMFRVLYRRYEVVME